jgi:hypothetical protein
MAPYEYSPPSEDVICQVSDSGMTVVQTPIESHELSSVSREMTATIQRAIAPELYDRLRAEMHTE